MFPDQLDIPDEVLRIARRLEGAGFETWCVGGAVRDNLLGFPNKDFDLATAARPEQVRKLFKRTIPVGLEHGTVAVLDRSRKPHEVTTFRRDVKTDGRHAEVEFGVSLEEDLARRDFTINAIAYHPLNHEWRDPFDGGRDLAGRLVRAVGDPTQRFREDYLRILRALRFAARFGFRIDPDTFQAAKANAPGLEFLSAERVRDEWFRGIETARMVGELVQLWEEVRAFETWLPEIGKREEGKGKREKGRGKGEKGQGEREKREGKREEGEGKGWKTGKREKRKGKRQTAAIDRFPRDPVLITSYLSADPAATLLRLKCSNAEVERGRRIGEHRGEWPDPGNEIETRKWLARVGPAADDLLTIASTERWGGRLVSAVREVQESGAAITVGDLAVGGEDLMAAGVPQGPMVGQLLRELLEEVIEHPDRNTADYLLHRVRQEIAEASEGGGKRATDRRR